MSNNTHLDIRRRRIKFRAWHRGMREMDLILGSYIDAHIDAMSAVDLDEFEQILTHEDRDLLQFILDRAELPPSAPLSLLQHIIHYTQEQHPANLI